jgi:hypothetical protein
VAAREMRLSVLLRLHLIVVSMIMLSLGGWIASRIHGFQTSFEVFDRSHIPYYKIMYYGSVGQDAFRSLVIIMSLVRFAVCGLQGHKQRRRTEPQNSQRGGWTRNEGGGGQGKLERCDAEGHGKERTLLHSC